MKYGTIAEWRPDFIGEDWVMTMFCLGKDKNGLLSWMTLADTDSTDGQGWEPGFIGGDLPGAVVTIIEEAS
jgi:hypothetical protein